MHFIVKLFPEIIIKSAPVRKSMIRQLRRNLRTLIATLTAPEDPGIEVRGEWDRIEIQSVSETQTSQTALASGDMASASGEDPEAQGEDLEAAVAELLTRTPGIANCSRVVSYPLYSNKGKGVSNGKGAGAVEAEQVVDYDYLADCAWASCAETLPGKRFVVRVKRTGKHGFASPEAERQIGGRLLARAEGASVSLKNPEVVVRLEVTGNVFYVLESTRQGIGGFPMGVQQPVLSLVSGGFDSTVASYLTMKRGIRTHFCFFNLGGRAHELGVKEVAHFLWQKYGASHRVKFITVPFEDVVAEILTSVDNSQMGVVLKRMMLRAASTVAKEWHVDALVTGESVAQVASQTLPNLAVIDAATDMLTLRPLVVMDKNQIINIAREIGTEEFAANMPEYCGVISVKPTTNAKRERIEAEEGKFDFAVLERAVAARREENIDDVMESDLGRVEVEIFSAPQPGVTILDIRHPDDSARRALTAGNVTVETSPFYQVQNFFDGVAPETPYLLYCDKGVMSRLHAELLVERGFARVGVYRP